MSAMNSIFVLTEQPPLLGTIRERGAADQIKSFLVARKKWARRQAKGAALPTLVQLMEESDVDLLSTIAIARFQQEDEMAYPAEYKDRAGALSQRDVERFWISDDDEDGAEEEDNTSNLLGIAVSPRKESATRRDSNLYKRVSRQDAASEAIEKRRQEFEETMLDDDNLLALLSVVYGPKSKVESLTLLEGIRMSSEAPYHSLQTAAEYLNEFKDCVRWIRGTEHRLTDKQLTKQFIKGVQPAKFRKELELLEIESFITLVDNFNKIYYKHHQSICSVIAAGGIVDSPSKAGERSSAGKDGAERGRWRGPKPDVSSVTVDGTPSVPTATKSVVPPQPQKPPPTPFTPIKTIVKGSDSAAKASKADVECFHCHGRGHYANACPQKAVKSATSPESPKTPWTPAKKRSLRRSDEVPKRAILACCVGDVPRRMLIPSLT